MNFFKLILPSLLMSSFAYGTGGSYLNQMIDGAADTIRLQQTVPTSPPQYYDAGYGPSRTFWQNSPAGVRVQVHISKIVDGGRGFGLRNITNVLTFDHIQSREQLLKELKSYGMDPSQGGSKDFNIDGYQVQRASITKHLGPGALPQTSEFGEVTHRGGKIHTAHFNATHSSNKAKLRSLRMLNRGALGLLVMGAGWVIGDRVYKRMKSGEKAAEEFSDAEMDSVNAAQ